MFSSIPQIYGLARYYFHVFFKYSVVEIIIYIHKLHILHIYFMLRTTEIYLKLHIMRQSKNLKQLLLPYS